MYYNSINDILYTSFVWIWDELEIKMEKKMVEKP